MNRVTISIACCFLTMVMVGLIETCAQKPEDVYKEALQKVLTQVGDRFQVQLHYDKDDVQGHIVQFAPWRFSTDVESTLDNILKPLDLVWQKTGDKAYRIRRYEYYRRSEAEGKRHLDQLLASYHNADEFERRKTALRGCILNALGISRIPSGALNIIAGPTVKMRGYTVQNVAFESVPGYYVTGTLYRPAKGKGPFPVVLSPHGHFYNPEDPSIREDSARYRADMQYRCAALAKMGAIVLSYDMYAWGESVLFTGGHAYHETGFALAMQTLNSMRALDFLLAQRGTDKNNVAVTGASGGGTQTILVAALDDRVKVTVPVVMVSSAFFGGCPCESGLPIHAACDQYRTNNAEIAAMMAPRPQLLISDGDDWTTSMPGTDFPYLKKVYGFYGKEENVEQVYLSADHHDYGVSKRVPMYHFLARTLHLDLRAITGKDGKIDEHDITIQKPEELRVFGKGARLPDNALRSHDDIVKAFRVFQAAGSD